MINKVSFKDQVYQYLKSGIIKGELKTGEIYSEQQIATRLEVSRTPVREAVIRLVNEGMLEVLSNRGWTVRPVAAEDIQEIIQARIAIEGYCVRYLARHYSEAFGQDYLARLKACQAASERFALDENSHYEYMKADTDFHSLLVESTGNSYLLKLSNQMRAKVEQATYNSLNLNSRSAMACFEHQEILKQLMVGNEEAAIRAFMLHMEKTAQVLGTSLPE